MEHKKCCTVISNTIFKDKSLSLKAKGLLTQMLSLPDTWDYSLKGLSYLCRDGVDSIRTAVGELENAGYVVRQKVQNEHGHFDVIYIIKESPDIAISDVKNVENSADSGVFLSSQSENTMSEVTASEHPALDIPTSEIKPQSNTISTIKKEKSICVNQSTQSIKCNTAPLGRIDDDYLAGKENVLSSEASADLTREILSATDIESVQNLDCYSCDTDLTEYQQYQELLKDNLECDTLVSNFKKENVNPIFDILCETVCRMGKIRVSGCDFPAEVVKSRFLKLRYHHIEYVLDSIEKCDSEIRNMKAYLLTCLYNSYTTYEAHTTTAVNNFMNRRYGGRENV
jgi:hypothetical protein